MTFIILRRLKDFFLLLLLFDSTKSLTNSDVCQINCFSISPSSLFLSVESKENDEIGCLCQRHFLLEVFSFERNIWSDRKPVSLLYLLMMMMMIIGFFVCVNDEKFSFLLSFLFFSFYHDTRAPTEHERIGDKVEKRKRKENEFDESGSSDRTKS